MKKSFGLMVLFIILSCKEKYTPKIQSPSAGFLVVEGYINSGSSPSTFTLTRATKLYDTSNILYENNALLDIQGENQEDYPLFFSGNGHYTSDTLHLNSNERYRLQIKTQDGKEYVSDYAAVKFTPPIDSVSWVRDNDGITLYVSTHDPQNNPGYYRWDYDETWEIHSAFQATLKYIVDTSTYAITGVEYRNPDHSYDSLIFRCWRSDKSSTINLGSTEKLTTNIIYLPILKVPEDDEKLSVLYSANIKQYALTKDEYDFYQTLKTNTEELGSIFDPLPTGLPSNIHCITDPKETVVGYVSVLQEQDKRIFISNQQVPGWNYHTSCFEFIIANNTDSIRKYGYGTFPTVPYRIYHGQFVDTIVDFYVAPVTCVDCTIRGINSRPPYWP